MSTLKVNSIEGATGGEVDINATLGSIPSLVITGVTTVSAGTTSAPAITPSGDSNTGIFFPSADTIAFAEGGVEAARFDNSGRLGIGTNNPTSKLDVVGDQRITGTLALGNRSSAQSGFFIDGSTAGDYGLIFRDSSDADRGIFLKSGTAATGVSLVGTNTANRHLGLAPGDTEKVRITSTGNVGIGTDNPSQKLQINDFSAKTVTPLVLRNYATGSGNTKVRIALQGITASGQGAVATIQSISGTDAGGSNANNDSGLQFIVTNSGAGTENIAMTVNTNGNVGVGTTGPTAKLEVNGNSTFNGSFTLRSNNTVRGYFGDVDSDTNIQVRAENALTFKAGGNTERARFNTTGAFVLAGGTTTANGIGIAFPATQSASSNANTLDDYEEGTFTPTIFGTSATGTGTYLTQVGRYTKVGNRVHYQLYTTWSAHTGTGNFRIGGLPFTSSSASNSYSAATLWSDNITLTTSHIMIGYVNPNSTTIVIESYAAGGGPSTNVPVDTSGGIMAQGSYEV